MPVLSITSNSNTIFIRYVIEVDFFFVLVVAEFLRSSLPPFPPIQSKGSLMQFSYSFLVLLMWNAGAHVPKPVGDKVK